MHRHCWLYSILLLMNWIRLCMCVNVFFVDSNTPANLIQLHFSLPIICIFLSLIVGKLVFFLFMSFERKPKQRVRECMHIPASFELRQSPNATSFVCSFFIIAWNLVASPLPVLHTTQTRTQTREPHNIMHLTFFICSSSPTPSLFHRLQFTLLPVFRIFSTINCHRMNFGVLSQHFFFHFAHAVVILFIIVVVVVVFFHIFFGYFQLSLQTIQSFVVVFRVSFWPKVENHARANASADEHTFSLSLSLSKYSKTFAQDELIPLIIYLSVLLAFKQDVIKAQIAKWQLVLRTTHTKLE